MIHLALASVRVFSANSSHATCAVHFAGEVSAYVDVPWNEGDVTADVEARAVAAARRLELDANDVYSEI